MKKLYFIIIILTTLLYPKISGAEESILDKLGWMDHVGYIPFTGYESNSFLPWGDDEFGDFYIVDKESGLIYHPRTYSYWYMYGDSPDSLFIYGSTIAGWAWTSKSYFPWIYFFGSKDPFIIRVGWGYIDYIEVRPDGEVWAQMVFPETSSGFRQRVILPF